MRLKGVPEIPETMVQQMTRREATRIINRFGGYDGANNGSYEMRLRYLMLTEKHGKDSEKVDDWMMYWRREISALIKYHTPKTLWEKALAAVGIQIKI
tara:strand:+ start:3655 stop:3948 length:294 start_codon:yes stop_codon:yes gene_type:complete